MKIVLSSSRRTTCRRDPERGSLLIIVLWITFGLVSLALYFGHSILFELRAADQNTAGVEAEQAIEGAARYIGYTLTNRAQPGHYPDTNYFRFRGVPVGDATFWVIGRTNMDEVRNLPVFGLVDEGSKLNLNTVTSEMLSNLQYYLPTFTPMMADAIIDWRDTDEEPGTNGVESEYYLRLTPSYQCKNAPFDSVDELRMVAGIDRHLLYGEDANLNGTLDPNENDGNITPPFDNRDGRLDPGLYEYFTVFSREPSTNAYGTNRIDITSTNTDNLVTKLTELFGQQRATEVQSKLTSAGTLKSLVQFYVVSGLSSSEFEQLEDDLCMTNGAYVEGLVNINTAPEPVLACIPGIGVDNARQVISYRKSNAAHLGSVAWLVEALSETNAVQAGPYITTRSYQFAADIVALGHHGRGYRRTFMVFDTSEGVPKILYRRDRARLGWALGTLYRERDTLATTTRSWRN